MDQTSSFRRRRLLVTPSDELMQGEGMFGGLRGKAVRKLAGIGSRKKKREKKKKKRR